MKLTLAIMLVTALVAPAALAGFDAADRDQFPIATSGHFPTEEHEYYVPSGKSRVINRLYGARLDCSTWNAKDIDYKLTMPPKNGTVEFVLGDAIMSFKADNPLAKCNGKRAQAVKIIYKANDKFVGADNFEVFIILPNAKARERRFTINVK